MKHIISTKHLSREWVTDFFRYADGFQRIGNPLHGKILATLFYEPSTRTRLSFESAMIRLGGSVISTENANQNSSVSKGETLEDTTRVLNTYADIIVLRHSEKGAADRAALVSNIPIINAGDGYGEHPTQSLLDAYTIYKELDRLDSLSVGFMGDLRYGRTVHSLINLLSHFPNVKFYFISVKELELPNEIKYDLKEKGIPYQEVSEVSEVINQLDVLYQTRVQKERFDDLNLYEKVKHAYILKPSLVEQLPKHALILHPFPRTEELPEEIDENPRAAYFKQVAYGLLVRMALLRYILHK